jgi:hypothetical protein
MRRFLAALFTVSCLVEVASAGPVTSLERKPGLWTLEVTVDGEKEQGKMKQCIDAKTDARMMQMAGQIGASCTKNQLTKSGSFYTYDSECTMSGSTMKAKGVFKGDFDSKYEGEIVTTISPPLFGQSSSTTKLVGSWVGNCPTGMNPGDMVMPNGMKVSLEQMRQGARIAAQMATNPEMAQLMQNLKGLEGGAQALQDAMKNLGNMAE